MAKDAQGLTITGTANSADALDRAIADYYAWKGDPVALLQDAAVADPAFSLGHSATASLFLLSGFTGDSPDVVEALTAAEATASGATTREQMHLAAAQAFARGEMFRATDIWEDILLDTPRDPLALRFAHDTYFYLGASQSIRDSVARVLPHWSAADQQYGYILGQYAFGLEEAGELGRAERAGRQAIEINPEDGWAVHAIAHVFETECRQEEGIEFLIDSRPQWGKGAALAVHNGWHLALYLIEQGRLDKVLAGYDIHIQPKIADDALLDLVDAASLLWRVELAGGSVGDRWQELTRQWMTHLDEHVLAFNDLHLAFCAARSGDADNVTRLRASLDRYAKDGAGDNHATTVAIGRRLIDGVLAFANEDYAHTVDCLLPIRYQAIRIGGSHAQRDVLTQTLIAAAERSGQLSLARALLTERLALRPTDKTRSQLDHVSAALTARHSQPH
ncbi:tetratricopeptide repeat protein [uncultured Nitratireductor sp.]|uniref:tetratricopeptide repeat protein n=1 Tax=uncultured Nitratireductor sp. TaxID=520953 RepID=UPI00261E05C1|nr:tetratricopeptide repeat protein [uncultured Nitratireductor sp.]